MAELPDTEANCAVRGVLLFACGAGSPLGEFTLGGRSPSIGVMPWLRRNNDEGEAITRKRQNLAYDVTGLVLVATANGELGNFHRGSFNNVLG